MMTEFSKSVFTKRIFVHCVTWEFHHICMFHDCVLSSAVLFFSEFIFDQYTKQNCMSFL